jgi:hypothetical protein
LTILTYAFSEVSRQGEPMDWIRNYGKGRVYTTMLGHTWKDEANPNLDDVNFQALLARGTEWAASGKVTLPPDLGWKPLFNAKNLDGWEIRGPGVWTVMPDGVLMGQHAHPEPTAPFPTPGPIDQAHFRDDPQAWLYTKAEFGEFDLHLEYWTPPGDNSGVSIRDRSRAHVGYEIRIVDDDKGKFGSGSVDAFVGAKTGIQRRGEWNSMEIESRNDTIRVRLNGQVVAEYRADPTRSKTGPIGLQLHDQFTLALFRNIRIRPR